MSIQDKIASALLKNHQDVLKNFDKRAGGWITQSGEYQDHLERNKRKEYKKTTVQFAVSAGHQPRLVCAIADTPELQVLGLQNHPKLGSDEGMIFPQPEPRKVTFHMGSVAFPIDIMYVGSDGRVGRIESNVEPNTAGAWSHPHVINVIEAPGGWAKKNGVEVGTFVGEVAELQKEAQLVDLSLQNAMAMYPDAIKALQQIYPNLNVELYQYFDTLGMVPPDPGDEMYWDGAQWVVFGTEVTAQLKQFDPQTKTFTEHPVLTSLPKLKGPPQGAYGYDPVGTPFGPVEFNDQMTDIGLEPTQISPPRPQKPDVPWDAGTPTQPPQSQTAQNDDGGGGDDEFVMAPTQTKFDTKDEWWDAVQKHDKRFRTVPSPGQRPMPQMGGLIKGVILDTEPAMKMYYRGDPRYKYIFKATEEAKQVLGNGPVTYVSTETDAIYIQGNDLSTIQPGDKIIELPSRKIIRMDEGFINEYITSGEYFIKSFPSFDAALADEETNPKDFLSEEQFKMNTQDTVMDTMQAPAPKRQLLNMRAVKSFERLQRLLEAQERFTPAPRKDINPLMVPSDGPYPDRYRSKDLPDEVWRRMPIDDDNWQEQFGYDPSRNLQDDENVPAIRPAPGP